MSKLWAPHGLEVKDKAVGTTGDRSQGQSCGHHRARGQGQSCGNHMGLEVKVKYVGTTGLEVKVKAVGTTGTRGVKVKAVQLDACRTVLN